MHIQPKKSFARMAVFAFVAVTSQSCGSENPSNNVVSAGATGGYKAAKDGAASDAPTSNGGNSAGGTLGGGGLGSGSSTGGSGPAGAGGVGGSGDAAGAGGAAGSGGVPGGGGAAGSGGTCLGDGDPDAGSPAIDCSTLPYASATCGTGSTPLGVEFCKYMTKNGRADVNRELLSCLTTISSDPCSAAHDTAAQNCFDSIALKACHHLLSSSGGTYDPCKDVAGSCVNITEAVCNLALSPLSVTKVWDVLTCYSTPIGACDQDFETCVDLPHACTPSCVGKICGSDGCQGICGTCGSGSTCKSGTCCTTCAAKTCGPDGCGGTCGVCADGFSCSSGSCIADECDPVMDIGCSSPEGCWLLSSELPSCSLTGTGSQGASCTTTSSCDGGYACFSGKCRKICNLSTGQGCVGGQICSGVTGWVKHGACY